MQLDFSRIILSFYSQGWMLWVAFLIIGFVMFKYANQLDLSRREIRKIEKSGAGLFAFGIVIHLFLLVALIKS
jgi:hypothetical protein